MKILHSADWHLGTKNLKLPAGAQQLLKDEITMKVQDLFRKAMQEDYDVILICGDLFHSKNPSLRLILFFLKEVESFRNPVLYVSGNHDPNIFFNKQLPSNFIILDDKNTCFNYMGVNFYSPFAGEIDESKTNILLLHGNIENTRDNDYVDINQFLVKPFDYIALGHVHNFRKYQKGDTAFAYSGSLFSNGFDECGEKGVIEVVIKSKKIERLNFVGVSSRRYMICECDITGLEDNYKIINQIQKTLFQNEISKNDMVRVVLTGKFDENTQKSLQIIKNHFEDYFYFEIVDQSILRVDVEKIKAEKLSFKYEFISLVENSDLSDEDKQKICEIGLDALKGEGIII